MIRTLDGTFLEEVANHPDVRPWIGGKDHFNARQIVANPDHVTLQFDGGGFVFCKIAEGLYEAHTLFLPEHRGKDAVRCLREALRYMFTATECQEILTRVPDGNDRADGFARIAGGVEAYRLEHDPRFDGKPVSVRALSLDRWRAMDDECLKAGQEFHRILEAAGQHDGHPDEEAHDRAVGASVLMFRQNNFAKAVWAYNRWAAMAGYAQVEMASHSPVIISMGKVFVAMLDGRIEVLKCPS
jgi:hypothetical protein